MRSWRSTMAPGLRVETFQKRRKFELAAVPRARGLSRSLWPSCLLIMAFVTQSVGCSSTRQISVKGGPESGSTRQVDAETFERTIETQLGKRVEIYCKNSSPLSGRLESYDGQELTVKLVDKSGHAIETRTINKTDIVSISQRHFSGWKTGVLVGSILAGLGGVLVLLWVA